MRLSLIVISAIQAVFAGAFILQIHAVTQIWPLPYTNATSYLFIGSIFAAAAASTLWCVFAREYRALVGIALDYIAILLPLTILLSQISTRAQHQLLTPFGAVSGLGVIFGVWLAVWGHRFPVRHTQPAPRPVVWAFVFFVVALLIAGGQMVLRVPNILPWNISMDSQIIYGWMFLGAAIYFAYGVLRQGWYNAAGQLFGFLAYDLVLIGPFLARLGSITPDLLPNLIVYILVLTFSGLLAIYYLFIHAPTRVWRSRGAQPIAASE